MGGTFEPGVRTEKVLENIGKGPLTERFVYELWSARIS